MSRDFAIDPVSYVFDNVELAGAIYSDETYLPSQFNSVALTILQERQSRILQALEANPQNWRQLLQNSPFLKSGNFVL